MLITCKLGITCSMQYVTVTERGMATIPARVRRRYNIKPGAKLKVVEGETGVTLVPMPKFEDLYGVDGESALASARELLEERKLEASHDSEEL